MRLCYKGTWIDPEPLWYWAEGLRVWEARVLMDLEGPQGPNRREIIAPGRFHNEETAFHVGLDYAKKLIDGSGA